MVVFMSGILDPETNDLRGVMLHYEVTFIRHPVPIEKVGPDYAMFYEPGVPDDTKKDSGIRADATEHRPYDAG